MHTDVFLNVATHDTLLKRAAIFLAGYF